MDATKVKRGAEVARGLGWPAGERGIVGALGDLFAPDLFRFQRPLSYQRMLQHQQQAYDKQIRHAFDLAARKALRETKRRHPTVGG